MDDKLRIPQATGLGYAEVRRGGVFDISYPSSRTRRGRVQGNMGDLAPTITTHSENALRLYEGKMGKVRKYRIRKFTPRECFRLMDVEDKNIDRIQEAGISKSQQYKMAGNSIVVNCMYHIFKNLFIGVEHPTTLF